MTLNDNIKNPFNKAFSDNSSTPSPFIRSKSSLPSPDSMTFEETYKTAYSHGLETIYALENVDIKSIRPIRPMSFQKAAPPKTVQYPVIEKLPDQLELDLGDAYRGWINAFVKREPIHVLGLSRHAEKCLLDHGKRVLGDLTNANLKDFVFLKGMGQGHVDEIQQKLSSYLEGRPLERCTKIDFASWIRSIVAAFDRKKVYVAMEKYNLSDLFSLSPSESVETRRLTLEKKQEWIQEAHSKFQQASICNSVKEQFREVAEVFIKPWMRRRHGFATLQELDERVERLGLNSAEVVSAMVFFSDLFFDGAFVFDAYLYPLEKGIFCADPWTRENYIQIIQRACSYFYRAQTVYPLDQLVGYLEKEFARLWQGFPDGFILKILRLSPCFRVRKGNAGVLEIRLA